MRRATPAAALLAGAVIVGTLYGGATSASTAETLRVLRVLFVGNSLTAANGLPDIVESLSKARGNVAVDATVITAGNFSLEDHWNQGNARTAVANGKFSFVVFQQGPLGSYVAALTFWRALSGASVVGLPGPSSVPPAMLPLLQVAADRAATVSGLPARSGVPR